MSDLDIEKQVQEKGLTAPRVSLADINEAINCVEIVTFRTEGGQTLRWAVITMKNGFAVTGKPSCSVSPENDDEELGESIAVKNAKDEIWALMGYALKDRLASGEKS